VILPNPAAEMNSLCKHVGKTVNFRFASPAQVIGIEGGHLLFKQFKGHTPHLSHKKPSASLFGLV